MNIRKINEELNVKLPFDPNKKTWYHGTTEYFDKFDLQYFGKTDVGFLGKGVYLAGNYSSAQSYSYPSKLDYIPKEAHVYVCKVNITNPYIILNDERYNVYEYQLRMDLGVNSNRDITPELQKRGYDSVLKCNKFELGYDIELCVFNPEQVTIIDEIPDKSDKRDIYYNKPLKERFDETEIDGDREALHHRLTNRKKSNAAKMAWKKHHSNYMRGVRNRQRDSLNQSTLDMQIKDINEELQKLLQGD